MMARSSSKQIQQQQQGHVTNVHQRLYHALNLGLKSSDGGGRKFQFLDVGIQRLVLRSIDAFLDCISAERLKNPLVKDSVPDMVGALGEILQLKNEATLSLASNMVVKMINVVPRPMLQPYLLDLIRPLVSLLPSHQLQVVISCATALDLILSNLSSKKEKEVWEILKDMNTVAHVAKNIREFSAGSNIEFFEVTISLLAKILWRWPPSRLYIWSDAKLMDVLESIILGCDSSVKVVVLQLCTSLALCGTGAQKLLEREVIIMHIVEHCMTSSSSTSIQIEGFKLAQCLAINEQMLLKMMQICCEPIIRAITNVMSNTRSSSGRVSKDHMSLLTGACRLALITRWSGVHQEYFWKLGFEKVLLNLLMNNLQILQSKQLLPLEKQIALAQQGLDMNSLLGIRPYIWDILGGLAAHYPEDFRPQVHENESSVDLLITCACLDFVRSVHNARQLFQGDISELYRNESASRAVLMMIYSPSKYISHQARYILSEILGPSGKRFLKHILDRLNKPRNKFGILDSLQTVINLMSLACISALPQYWENDIKGQGIKKLVIFLRWCLSHDIRLNRSSLAPHNFRERTCCWVRTEDWDGENSVLLYCLWNIVELMHHSDCGGTICLSVVDFTEAQLVSELHRICIDMSSPGPRWYAACLLSYFGCYGFPNKFEKRFAEVYNENELSDVKLVLADSEPLDVHSVILMVRCPSLLPYKNHHFNDRSCDGCLAKENVENCERSKKEIRLSAHVDREVLLKLLEYVYSGYLKAEADLVRKLKILSRHCNLQDLLQLLCHKSPKWGAPFPTFDFTYALGPAGYSSSDIILESKGDDKNQWKCSTCSLVVPHMHVHKVILQSTSDYFQALFRSGMQESHSETIKVPVSWKALEKLVNWFYSDELPKPVSGCSWDNLDMEQKLYELHPYVELCWLAESWCLDKLHEESANVVIACLDADIQLSIKTIQIAADLSQWRLAEVAANYMAPLYQHLRNTGELEDLDEELVDMVRAASVRHSQEGTAHISL